MKEDAKHDREEKKTRNVISYERSMVPFVFAKCDETVDEPYVDYEPNSKSELLLRLFRNEKRKNKFPAEIKGQGKERHAVGACLDTATGEKNVAKSPEGTSNCEESSGNRTNV
jgi:hypothetical protein